MVKSTVGTWLNYATTALFQVFFARRFGATPAASAYAVTFTLAVGIGAIFVGATQAVYLPRLLGSHGQVSSAVLRRMSNVTFVALASFLVLAGGASLVGPVVAPRLDGLGIGLVGLIRLACVFGFSQVLVGQLAALSWARGARFVPAVSPVWPSILAVVALLTDGRVSPATLYVMLTVGSFVQMALLAMTACRGLRFSKEPYDRRGVPPMLISLGTLAAAQIIAPFEVLIAANASSTGGADFNYGYRAIVVAQALIVGGIVAAALPDWSAHVRAGARVTFERSLARTVSMAALALSAAAAVGLVASNELVRLAFQRGTFTAHDTQVVSAIVVAALIGFVAEGTMLVLSQAILADRRIRAAMAIGVGRTAVLMILVAIFGLTAGPVGVAVGYSAANVLALTAEVVYVSRKGLVTRREVRLAQSTVVVTMGTGLTAVLLRVLHIPALAGAVLVMAVFTGFVVTLRGPLPRLRTPIG